MRHIPEEELHAYLDQALSRAQCVEIESHLAGCAGCGSLRDGIAALRDRTTALLATLSPPRGFTPAIDLLQERATARSARRHHVRRAAAWAASIVFAVGIGWWANTFSRPVSRPVARVAAAVPAAVPAVATHDAPDAAPDAAPDPIAIGSALTGDRAVSRSIASTATPRRAERAPRLVSAPTMDEPPRAELSSGSLPSSDFESTLGGMWRTLSWAGAQHERGDSVPHIDGLPVVEVQVGQAKPGGSRSIMVVAQQLASGEVIRTIEGPAAEVSELLGSRPGSTSPSSPWPTMDTPGISGGDGAMAMRFGDRMLAITAQLPNDSLRAMMRRLNAEMRAK
ncbi:MAG: zf-HC2 domain-containing protein [Gemmatimonadota bacterium]